MIASAEFVKESFGKFNAEIFGGELPVPHFQLSRARSFLGKLRYKVTPRAFGRKPVYSDYTLIISTLYDLPQEELEDVVIHEMIHYLLMIRGIEDSSAHGPQFRAYMNAVNERFGRNITVSHKGRATDTKRIHYVGVCKLNGEVKAVGASRDKVRKLLQEDKVGLIVCSKDMAPRIAAGVRKAFPIGNIDWYVTNHPYFNKFPHLRTVKMYLVPRTELPTLTEN
ncbi:MAG: SprT-like domain-containing protein [Candidatus Cryptobacteroides sp.]